MLTVRAADLRTLFRDRHEAVSVATRVGVHGAESFGAGAEAVEQLA